jgi:peptidoglycan/xylan/chitin deacetylase (PgdA/CDA1 family)
LSAARLPRAVFTLSLDFELIWGALDLFGPDAFREACLAERAHVVDRLLALLAELDVRASWLVAGHLLLERCQPVGGVKHPEVVRPTHAWSRGDWFADDPGGDESSAPLFFARSLVERIRQCRVPQEIGGHSFSHVIYGDAGCSRATAESDLDALVAAAEGVGLTLRSFSFPRNRVGHADALAPRGFRTFRTPEPAWWATHSGAAHRLGHLADVLLAREPPVVLPIRRPDGLVEVPGSMIYFPAHGLRRFLPLSLRVRRAQRGLRAAVREGRVFHLWTHPTNLADETEAMFGGLRRILEDMAELRSRGLMEVRTLGELLPPGEDPSWAS